jgi:hypothetical protein
MPQDLSPVTAIPARISPHSAPAERSTGARAGSTHGPIMQNKPNLLRSSPPNADRSQKQTQTNPIAAGVLSAVERISLPHRPPSPRRPAGASSPPGRRAITRQNGPKPHWIVQNKPNFPRFWPPNADRSRKTNPNKPNSPCPAWACGPGKPLSPPRPTGMLTRSFLTADNQC